KVKKIDLNELQYLTSIENLIKNKRNFYWLKRFKFALISDVQEVDKINLLIKDGFKLNKTFVLNESDESLNKIFPQINKINAPVFKLNHLNFDFNQFKDVDGIILNIKNNGFRNDLSLDVLFKVMQVAVQYDKKLIVLDQPNPLSRFIDGPGDIPLQHALTVAELAEYFNNYVLQKKVKLTIIPMIGWQRKNEDLDVSQLYKESLLSILNQIEPINSKINEDLGLESVLLPKGCLSDWENDFLKKILFRLGFYCTDYSYYDKESKKNLVGVKIDAQKEMKSFSTFNSMLTLARFFKNRKNIKLGYSDSFDKMLGSSDTKEFLNNKISFKELKNNTQRSVNNFYYKSKRVLLYKPCPLRNDVKIIKS
ncbi:MAG: exo-beta-N-acetylmuramidase NamZ domain-containing protein, partial [bacterium]